MNQMVLHRTLAQGRQAQKDEHHAAEQHAAAALLDLDKLQTCDLGTRLAAVDVARDEIFRELAERAWKLPAS